jgi:hypothetical protein
MEQIYKITEVYRLKMKSSAIIIILTLILIPFTIRSQAAQTGTTNDCLRILDINVWSGLDYEGTIKVGEYETAAVREKRYQVLLSQIKQLDPDIIGIHEANKLPFYALRLARDTGYEAFHHVGVGGVRLGLTGLPLNLCEGDAIFIKKYLNPQFVGRRQLSGGYVGKWVSFHFKDATQIIGVKITFQDRPIFIYATHWHASLTDAPYMISKAKELIHSGEITETEYQDMLSEIEKGVAWRLSESKKTIEFIEETAKDQFYILMGDFNTELGSQEINNLFQFGMVDMFQYSNPHSACFTWDPRTNLNIKTHYLTKLSAEKDKDGLTRLENWLTETPRRIDYIFLGPSSLLDSKNVVIQSSKVVMKEIINGVHASDHYGIFAEIQIHR